MEPGIEQGVDPRAAAPPHEQSPPRHPSALSSQPPEKPGPSKNVASPSPAKRRSSEGPTGVGDGPSVVHSPATLAKRPKTNTHPPKVLPERYELCPVEDMVVLVANMLGELIETNDALALKSGHLTRFHSR